MLAVLSCYHGPHTVPARRVWARDQTNGSSNNPRAESSKCQNTQTHHTAFWYLFTNGIVAQSSLLRPIIKHRSCKQTRRAQKWKAKVRGKETCSLTIKRDSLTHVIDQEPHIFNKKDLKQMHLNSFKNHNFIRLLMYPSFYFIGSYSLGQVNLSLPVLMPF